MKLAFLVGDEPGQRALCEKAAASGLDVGLVVISANRVPVRITRRRRWINAAGNRTVGRPLVEAWRGVQARYDAAHRSWPDVPLVRVQEVNDGRVAPALAEHGVELAAVSGTNLVRPQLIDAVGAMTNLHTGLSPYVKGGPNCTNWCLARGWMHLIGSTVMWIDAGVDSGRVITSERAPLSGTEDLLELHWLVMEHAHDLYLRALSAIAAGRKVPSVPQRDLGEGAAFRTAQWTPRQMARARIGFARRYGPASLRAPADLRTVPLGGTHGPA